VDEITDDSNNVDSLPNKRRIYTLFLLLGVVGGLVLFVAIAFWYFKRVDVPPPKMPQPMGVLSFAATCVVGMAAREARPLAFSGWNGRGRWEVTIDKITEQFEDEGVEHSTSRSTS
jgi:hypothetical protein